MKIIHYQYLIKLNEVFFKLNGHKKISMEDFNSYDEDSILEAPEYEQELTAIYNLDFERALELSKKRYQYDDTECFEEQIHYEEQAQILAQQNFDDYNQEINLISKEFLNNAENFKTRWKNYCQNLVEKHRQEAEQLEKKWRQTRKKEINRNCLTSETSLETARLLALCEHYNEAINLRDSAKSKTTSKKTPEIKLIDREFTKRYQLMIKRHYNEFQLLHRNLRSLLKSLRERAEALKKKAEANFQVENARNTTLIIQAVAKDSINPVAKEKVISSFSPRTRKNLPLSSNTSTSAEMTISNVSPQFK
ncbi:hypothetical protein TRFO_37814 [Tritrichomonas foetus]|uniref:Uncharacterized protein n=1 Tax=Tritrichomonas foetus TaxID=1144522 RepID=A0A1J4JCS7_9EUKA|nr:hypothetical protein TRFO_37814 [Tritrichomonas foetus]|eukprot:OHS96063.1 hypothetical protein TRFO_37814 [Tritrichomonas foetus]